MQRQNVVRGRERFAFRAKFKLDLSDYHTRTWPKRLCPQLFYHIVNNLLDGFLIWCSKGVSLDNDSLAVVNDVTLVKRTLTEVLMTTEETRHNLLGFQDALRHVHVEIENHHLATLLLSLTESRLGLWPSLLTLGRADASIALLSLNRRLDAVLAFNALTVTQLSVDGVFGILVANC